MPRFEQPLINALLPIRPCSAGVLFYGLQLLPICYVYVLELDSLLYQCN